MKHKTIVNKKVKKLVAKMDEKAIQNTVEHLFATCDPGNTGDITLVQWQGKCESDPSIHSHF